MYTQDLLTTFHWWFLTFITGLIFFPLVYKILHRFTDFGWAFARTASLLFVSYATFILSVLKIANFSTFTLGVLLAAGVLINLVVLHKERNTIFAELRRSSKYILISELLFIFGLFLWSWVRAHQPDIRGLEKFMDFGFVNSALNTNHLPPTDMWASGEIINYYWFGHFETAILTKLTRIPSSVTYNLMLAHIMGLTLSGVFSLVSTITKFALPKGKTRVFIVAGILSAILVTFAGNFHTPFYVLKNGVDNYWYPDATRFIGYNPDINDKTIHEFPIYSFVVSDLHGHLMNLPNVILYLSILFVVALHILQNENHFKKLSILGFLLGIMFMTSTWDVGNYLLATGFVLMLIHFFKRKFRYDAVVYIARDIVIVGSVLFITAFLFLTKFESIAEGVKFVHTRTPIWQLTILWGFPAILTVVFLTILLKIRDKITVSEIFILGLLITSWSLIALPEIIYLKDIYTASHYRANTMFKLTYQAYVMFYLSAGFVIARQLNLVRQSYMKRFFMIFWVIVLYSIASYAQIAARSYYNELRFYQGLDGTLWLKDQYPGEYAVVKYFENNNIEANILEAPGDSYTDYNVISSYTGNPTASGWFVHEWLWRGSSVFPQERVADIATVYTTADAQLAQKLLEKYNISYVIVGHFEKEKYPNLNEQKFSQMGSLVFESNGTYVYKMKQ